MLTAPATNQTISEYLCPDSGRKRCLKPSNRIRTQNILGYSAPRAFLHAFLVFGKGLPVLELFIDIENIWFTKSLGDNKYDTTRFG